MEHVTKKITNIFWYILIYATVLLAVALSLVRIAMPYAENYLGVIEQWAEAQLHLKLTISHLDSGWQGIGPALRFSGVTVADEATGKTLTTIEHVDVQLDVMSSLMKWDWVLGRLTVDGMVANLRESSGPEGMDVIPWPLIQAFKRITVKDAEIHWPMKQGNPITLNIIEFSTRPDKNKQRVELNMHLDDPRSRIQVIVDTEGNWMTPALLKIDGYARVKHVEFDPRYMPSGWHGFSWEQGTVNGDVWFDYDKGDWKRVIGLVNLKKMVIENTRTGKKLPFSFKGDVALDAKGEGHFRFIADGVMLSVHEKISSLTSWAVEVDEVKPWEARFNAISLFDAISIGRVLGYINPEMEKLLKQHDPHARLYNIEWIGEPEDRSSWRLGFQLSDAYEKSEGKWPGIDNLAGTVKLSATKGEFEMDSPNLTLVVPTVYPHALEIDSAKGLITWTYDPLEIQTSQFEFVENNLRATVDMALSIPKTGSPEIRLYAETNQLSRDDVLYYLPGKVLSPGLFHWISSSFIAGEITKATGRVEGAVKDFPFENGKGMFELQFALKNGTLHYKDHWPTLHAIDAQLVIDGKKFQSYIDTGRFQETEISQAIAAIDYSDPKKPLVLSIAGDIVGPASDAETFVKQSPLWETLGSGLAWVDINGTLHTKLDLKLPLDNETQADAAGTLSMEKGEILIPSWKIGFHDVTGAVSFKNGCISGRDVQALFMQRPATLNVGCKDVSGYRLHDWVLSSRFDIKEMDPYINPMFKPLIQGSSAYSITLSTVSRQGDSTLTFLSDLKGITVNAPSPIGKIANTSKPLSIRVPLKSETAFVPVINYDGLFNAAVLLKKEGVKLVYKGVNIVLGKEPAEAPKTEGITLGGKLITINVDPWLSFFEKLKSPSATPLTVKGGFWADTLLYKGFRLDDTYLSWQRLAQAWEVMLDGPGAKGVITVPDTISASNPLSLQFERYVWKPNPSSAPSPDADPHTMPALNFNCRQFFYQQQLLGEVSLRVRPDPAGVLFDPVIIKSDIHELTAKGSWLQMTPGISQTLFQGNGKTSDIGKTLLALGIKGDIEDSKTETTFDIRWPGSPAQFNKAKLSGTVNIQLKKGRLTGVNMGLGRLLGLFSVESIARRLQFDFSDLFQKGFAFDSFQSKITIQDGVATTKDATMKAPSANMTLSGKMVLGTGALDMLLDVRSSANKAVPTIGAAAVAIANPAVGAAMWLAGQMFNPLEGLGHYRYRITGTWQKPEFNDVSGDIPKEERAPVKEAQGE